MAKLKTDSTHWFEVSDIDYNVVLGTVTSPDDAYDFVEHLRRTYRSSLKLTEFLVLFHTRCAHRMIKSGQLVSYTEKVEPVRKLYISPDGKINVKDLK